MGTALLSRSKGILAGFLIATLLFFGCTITTGDPIPVPDSTIPASALLLDSQPFPQGWIVAPCRSPCDREGSDEALRSFGIVDVAGHVVQQVFHFANERDAQAKFRRYEETTSFSTPSEITYRSPLADDEYLRCGINVVPACSAGLRYGEYFVYFYLDIGHGTGEGLEMQDVEPVLRAMDERVAELFGLPMPPN